MIDHHAIIGFVDPDQLYRTESGFTFRWPMGGRWRFDPGKPGLYLAKDPAAPASLSRVAIVRHGPIETPVGRAAGG